jgi:hypothetical protein
MFTKGDLPSLTPEVRLGEMIALKPQGFFHGVVRDFATAHV